MSAAQLCACNATAIVFMNIRTLVLGGCALTVFAAGLSLARSPDYPVFNIEGVVLAFLDWEHHKHENIMTFRDKAHKSLMTGTMAPVHHTPWLKVRRASQAASSIFILYTRRGLGPSRPQCSRRVQGLARTGHGSLLHHTRSSHEIGARPPGAASIPRQNNVGPDHAHGAARHSLSSHRPTTTLLSATSAATSPSFDRFTRTNKPSHARTTALAWEPDNTRVESYEYSHKKVLSSAI